nr:hypothetical protein [Tanacetum cinerariifolium]
MMMVVTGLWRRDDGSDGHGGEGDGVVDVTVGRWLYGGDECAGWGGSGCCHGRLSRRGGVIRGGNDDCGGEWWLVALRGVGGGVVVWTKGESGCE